MILGLSSLSSIFVFLSLPSFTSWIQTYNRSYSSLSEYNYRENIYLSNLIKISKHNSNNNTWLMDVNNFTDLTPQEFKQQYSGCFYSNHNVDTLDGLSEGNYSALPKYINWTEVGAVTPVKNQGQCGSCWAFSTTGSIESASFLANRKFLPLSEQQLVDCSSKKSDQGCNGGHMDYGFQYVIDNKGITSEDNYPYTASNNNCNTSEAKNIVASISRYINVQTNSETALMTAIFQQPVSVAIEADQDIFQFYKSGVMTSKCGTNLDHGVLAVGYGTLNNEDYWIVKNSWGTEWGMNGYILLGRGVKYGSEGQCGIQMNPSYPVI